MFAGYYAHPRDVDEVIALVGLESKRGARVKTLSGGQKRRLDLGVALVGDPDLVFLDEPTTGFDPAARRAAWEMIRSLRALGKTVLLTTHYLDEAEQLADRVAVMREGVIVRVGTPRELTTARSRRRDPLPARRRGRRRDHDRADPRAARAHGRGARARRRARAARGAPPDARGRLPLAHRRRGGVSVRLFLHQLRYEQLLFWRSKEAALFIFLFPLLLFVLLGSVYGGRIYGVPAPQALLSGLIGYGCANTAFAGLAITLVVRREQAILKRLRATPLPASTYVAAQLVSTLIVFALQTVALFVLGRVLYGTPFPHAIGSLVLAVIFGAVVFAALGVADRVAHPLGRRLVRGRELHPPADGVPHGLLRADAPLPGVPARDRRRAAAEVLHRPDQCDLPQRARDLDEAPGARRSRRLGPRRPPRCRVQVPVGAREG